MVAHSERITESRFLPPWIAYEHEARYAFCRDFVEGKVVVDFGCGEGKGSRSMARGGPKMMAAMDRAVEAVSLVRDATGIHPVNSTAERLPLRNDSVDVIIALEVIEHFDDPDLFLDEVAAALKSDGTFFCSTPNRIVRNPRARLDEKPLNPWHLREWTTDEFRTMLERAFENVEMLGQSPQRSHTTALFNAPALIWKKGAAILRQLAKFRRSLWTPRGLYDVRPMQPDREYEFLLARCTRPRR